MNILIRIFVPFFIICIFGKASIAQDCKDWLKIQASPGYAESDEIDVPGTNLTVEARFTRTTPYSGGPLYAGDLVSKHKDPTDINYLLRPNGAEITTSNGYFRTPDACEIELNKTYHVAMVYNGNTLKFYRNGFLISQVAVTGNMYQNNWKTRIGFYEAAIHPENFIGYIDEVRIWNVPRTQAEIRANMNTSLSNPASQPGLLAYYTFENLANKQGNGAYNLRLTGSNINQINPLCNSIGDSCGIVVNDEILSTPDTTICAGAATTLRTRKGLKFSWTPSAFLDDPTSPNPVTTTPDSITYVVEATLPGQNIVVNGGFTQGTSGFTSQYSYVNTNTSESEYFVGNSAYSWNHSFSNCGDHTTGSGNMMMVNGSPNGGQVVWSQTVSVTPNTDYAFSTWIQSLYAQNPALLVFSINGNPIGPSIEPDVNPCNWNQFYATWNSGSNTTATISIENRNPQYLGNDFALDDISFAPYFTVKDTVHISVDKPRIQTSNDTSVCSGTRVKLRTTGGITYAWTPQNTLSSVSIPDPVANPSTSTKYIVTGTDAMGCSAQDSLTITILPKPIISLTNDTLICSNSPLRLSATGGQTYSWQPSTGLSDPSIADPVATVTRNTQFVLSVEGNNHCTASDSVFVSVRPHPVFSVSGNKDICSGKSAQLNASGGSSYEWTSSENISNANNPSQVVNSTHTATYTVHAVDSHCGFDTVMSVLVVVHESTELTIQKSNDISCNTPTAQLIATGASEYSWSPVTGLDNPAISNPVASIDTTTTYTVTATNTFGCVSTGSVTVAASRGGIPRFVVPNAFTPNGDNKNDCFGIRRWGSATLKQFSVYNRWGQIIFKTSDPSQCWDGNYKGKPMPAGAYAYIITAVTICGEVSRKGLVMLIR